MIVKLHDVPECAEPGCGVPTSATDGRCHDHHQVVVRKLVGPHVARDEKHDPVRRVLVLRGADR